MHPYPIYDHHIPPSHVMSHLLRTMQRQIQLPLQRIHRLCPPQMSATMDTRQTTLRNMRLQVHQQMARTPVLLHRHPSTKKHIPVRTDSIPAVPPLLHRSGRIRRQILHHMKYTGLCTLCTATSLPLFYTCNADNYFIV